MARLALKVTRKLDGVTLKIHYTKTSEGSKRWMELSKSLGKLAPVPSIFIEGQLAYHMTPEEEEFKDKLITLLAKKEPNGKPQ